MKTVVRLMWLVALVLAYGYYTQHTSAGYASLDMADALQQLEPSTDAGSLHARMMVGHQTRNAMHLLGWLVIAVAGLGLFVDDLVEWMKRSAACIGLVTLLGLTGCWRPFEPVTLEVIQPNEEAFLLPFTESIERQTSTHTEDYLRKSLVHTQQVKIPQQWVPRGYETFRANGRWTDAAILVRVDKSPVTREWTADPNSGTSSKNEAIWVMTSDQVEFSTGWTCTARVSSRDDAVKFLHNYPNGALAQVMDQEVRAKIQSAFGLEVTDLPMEELRLKATPHIQSVVDMVVEFFQERGITITNLGISGGFVYKDPSIVKTLVEVFNAEQAKLIAIAETATQSEKNKTLQLEADSRAKAILTERQAEAEGIKLVADAKSYEMSKATENPEAYMLLKRLEIDQSKIDKWDGHFPNYFMGQSVDSLNMLLQSPTSTLASPSQTAPAMPDTISAQQESVANKAANPSRR